MLFRKYKISFIKKLVLLLHVILLFSCQFKPVYDSSNLNSQLCSIKVQSEGNAAPLYEIDFKNELTSILCTHNKDPYNYILNWKIRSNYRELIKSETNTTRRYEQAIIVEFSIINIKSNNEVFSDTVVSKGAYNILEDEIISTISSNKSLESRLAVSVARLVLDKINLYVIKNEDSKL